MPGCPRHACTGQAGDARRPAAASDSCAARWPPPSAAVAPRPRTAIAGKIRLTPWVREPRCLYGDAGSMGRRAAAPWRAPRCPAGGQMAKGGRGPHQRLQIALHPSVVLRGLRHGGSRPVWLYACGRPSVAGGVRSGGYSLCNNSMRCVTDGRRDDPQPFRAPELRSGNRLRVWLKTI